VKAKAWLRRNIRMAVIGAALLGLTVTPAVVAAGSIDSPDASAVDSRIGIAEAQVVVGAEPDAAETPGAAPEQPEPESLPAGVAEGIEISPMLTLADQQEMVEGSQAELGLLNPEAALEREESELAFTNLSAEESEALLAEQFAPQLDQIDADPSRALSEVELEQVTSPTEVLATLNGEEVLLESTVPMLAPDEEGTAKVDLQLEETDRGFEPSNPLVETTLPFSAQGEVKVGQFGLSLQGASSAQAERRGDEDVYIPAAAEDTDLLLSPISGGVELSAMLLSRKSPEHLRFSVAMPEAARLQAAPDGGAEILDPASNEPVGRIGAPTAVDAQGVVVPMALTVEGDSVDLELRHHSLDVAYPLFIDPEIEEHWENFSDTSKLNYWQWEWSGVPSSETYIGQRSCIVTCWGNGLYVRSRSNTSYPAGSYGRWKFVPQGSTTYMRRVIFGPINYDPHGCSANEPHPYVGVYRDNGSWAVRTNAYPSGWFNWIDTGGQDLGAGSRAAFVGIHAEGAANIACGHDYRLGGTVLYLSDPENPSVGSISGYPTKWVKDNSPFTINVPVSDPGLGVKSATISPKDSPPLSTKTLGCSGHYDSPCPGSNTFQFANLTADSFDQGEKEVRVSATDAMTKSSNTVSFMMKVDRTPPDVTLSNQLAVATKETEGDAKDPTAFDPLSFSVYNLTIKAEDGVENGAAAQRRSGVASIEVFLDGGKSPLQTWTQATCSNSCGMTRTFTLKANELSALTHHTLKILVKDQAGNTPREREIGFEYVPATGMKEEFVLQHFPLTGEEPESGSSALPELAVNVMNGNLVYRQQDVDVPGPAADLEVERYYNSLLPESQDTEWGDGWTLAQTPSLEPEAPEGSATEATVVEESGALESQVDLPEKVGEKRFDEHLQAVISKELTGYEVTDESGEEEGTVQFNGAGEATELEASQYAGVEYDYDEGALSEIAVDDPASAGMSVEDAAERERLEDITPVFASAFGSQGSGNGQFKVLNDIAIDPTDGTLWVSDDENDRVQHFTTAGQFLGKFSTCYDPGAVLIDGQGNVYVACGGDIIRKYSDSGTTLQTISKGSGSGNGQVRLPLDLAFDSAGNLWVADTENDRVQQFDAAGNFKKALPLGSSSRPKGIAVAPDGDIWVTETINHRVTVLDQSGTIIRRFGSEGTGDGQLAHPSDVEVDSHGYAWVADSANDRVQIFNESGEFVTQFGAKGAGPGQFNDDWWIRLAIDAKGNVFATDQVNARVQRWKAPGRTLIDYGTTMQNDPVVDISVNQGLVEAVEGDEVGEIDYQHEGDLLTAVDAPEGDTTYLYDGNQRMTKVTLATGTFAEIVYEDTYGRVKSVTLSIENASPKTTYFNYEDQPQRRTTVTAPGVPVTTYEFAADGSMSKWWNTKKPPTIDDVAGTLHDNRETANPIAPGIYNLSVQAFSAEGMASVQVIANGNTIVSEQSCAQIPGPPVECEKLKDEWVTETAAWTPGISYFEVIATDALGESASERFWVNIPYTPPPDPEAAQPPTFSDILQFREDFGLDLDLNGDEEAINDRVFNLLGDWHNPLTSSGEVARATQDSWGVPMRSVDAAEMSFREGYIAQAATAVPQWAGSNGAASAYAGYYVDHRAGGLIYIGFTSAQGERIASLKSAAGLIAPDRVRAFPVQPTHSIQYLEALQLAVVESVGQPAAMGGVKVNVRDNRVDVGASNVSEVAGFLQARFGGAVPIQVYYEAAAERPSFARTRSSQTGPMKAADMIGSTYPGEPERVQELCSAGWGAWDRAGTAPDGRPLYRHFLTTAGHCFPPGTEVKAMELDANDHIIWQRRLGYVRRYSFDKHPSNFGTDAEAIRLEDPNLVPRLIRRSDTAFTRIAGTTAVTEGMVVCRSGAISPEPRCRAAEWPPKCERWGERYENGDPVLCTIRIEIPIQGGDSGGPYWERSTGKAVGTLTGGVNNLPGLLHGESWFTPAEELPGYPKAPGSLSALGIDGEPLHLVVWK
jgi:sugar lactone lactonase YvrE